MAEICQNLVSLYPQWVQDRDNRSLLTEIRRAFHTLKGSGRMAGAFALGDFGWAHEDMLNQILGGQLAATDPVCTHLGKAVAELHERLAFFQQAQQKDARSTALIDAAQAILAGELAEAPAPVGAAAPEALPEEPWLEELPPEPQDIALPALAEPVVEEAEEEEVFDFSSPVASSTPVPDPSPPALETAFTPPALEAGLTLPALAQVAEPLPEPAPAADTEADAESRLIWQLFWEEVPEQLQSLDMNLQNLRDKPHHLETIRALEREFHTLKGGARMAQLTVMADVSHEVENLLCRMAATGRTDEADIDRVQQAVDRLHTLSDHYQQLAAPPAATLPEPVAPQPEPEAVSSSEPAPIIDFNTRPRPFAGESGSMLERLLLEQADSLPDITLLDTASRPATPAQETDSHEASTATSHETIRLSAAFVDGLIDRVVELNVQQVHMTEHLSSMGMDVDELVRTVARLRQQIRTLELESEAQIHDGRSKWRQAQASKEGFDPLEMDQYAEIQRISRSLAESLNDLVNLEVDLAAQVRKGEQLLQADMRTTRKLQQELLNTRLVAVTVLVPRLRRLTRQVAGELGKQVVLEVQGEECELDRNLLQHMTAPLEHLIRNAISHGIETPQQREQQGKPPTGNIVLSVSRAESEIVIRFRDDGHGLDRQRLQQRAVAMGLTLEGQVLPDAELDRLILRPGFSTAPTVSQISGRGIGMDVVHSELKALGGSLQIESTPGQGTEFIMRLPFTLVVNPVLLVETQAQVYALPITGIQGLARLSGQQIQAALQAEGEEATVDFAGQPYHLAALGEVLGTPREGQVLAADERLPVVFVQTQGQAVAWVIERIRGRREVVLQPLGSLFKNCRLYSAATVAPDGRVFLVPDMAELARLVTAAASQPQVAEAPPAPPVQEAAGPPRVLVVDDSITVRRVTEKFLSSREYVVMTAKDGMEALERIAEFQPNAVLLDIEMPRMDGFELLGHLRRDPQWARLPVIMISSRTAQKHREHAGSLGATGFLGKPYQNEVLLDAIQDVLATGHEPDTTHEWEDMPA